MPLPSDRHVVVKERHPNSWREGPSAVALQMFYLKFKQSTRGEQLNTQRLERDGAENSSPVGDPPAGASGTPLDDPGGPTAGESVLETGPMTPAWGR